MNGSVRNVLTGAAGFGQSCHFRLRRTLVTIMQISTLIVAGVSAAISICLVAWLSFFSDSDAATRGLDLAAAWTIGILSTITVLPALLLAGFSRAPRTALAFALGFLAVFLLVLLGIIVEFM